MRLLVVALFCSFLCVGCVQTNKTKLPSLSQFIIEHSLELYDVLANENFTKVDLFTDYPTVSNYYYIKALINGKEAILFLDTGARATQLCQRFYASIKEETSIISNEKNDIEPVKTAYDTILQVGGITIPFFGISVVNLDVDNANRENDDKFPFMRIDGKIGTDVLKLGNAVVDLIGNAVFFTPPSNEMNHINLELLHENLVNRGPYGFYTLDMNLDSGWCISLAELNNIQGRFILDTGANVTVIDNKLSEKFKLISNSEVSAFGNNQIMHGSVASTFIPTKIGNTTIQTKPIFLDRDWINADLKQQRLEGIDGILGTDVLYLTVICFISRRLYIFNAEQISD